MLSGKQQRDPHSGKMYSNEYVGAGAAILNIGKYAASVQMNEFHGESKYACTACSHTHKERRNSSMLAIVYIPSCRVIHETSSLPDVGKSKK